MAIVPQAQESFLGGTADAQAQSRNAYEQARATGSGVASGFAQGTEGAAGAFNRNLDQYRLEIAKNSQNTQTQANGALHQTFNNQFLGRTDADRMAAAEVTRQAAAANTAAAQSIGGAAGARAAAGANAHAAIEANRVQALTAAQERGQMAQGQNQLNAINQGQGQLQVQANAQQQGNNLALLQMQQQQAQTQAQTGLGLSGQYVQGQLGQEGQISQNQQQYFQNQMASLQAKQAIAGQVMQGAGQLAGAAGGI